MYYSNRTGHFTSPGPVFLQHNDCFTGIFYILSKQETSSSVNSRT